MLKRLRHRGYDSCGICFERYDAAKSLQVHRTLKGYPKPDDQSVSLNGGACIAHTRYTTQGSSDCLEQAQPILSVGLPGEAALVHNGQIKMPMGYASSDTHYLMSLLSATSYQPQQILSVLAQVEGSYACLLLVQGCGIFAFRDPLGIRPLCYTVDHERGVVSFASESCALQQHSSVINVRPGEMIFVDRKGSLSHFNTLARPHILGPTPCLFEFIYLAHDDSLIDGISVREARKTMGKVLVPKIMQSALPIDVVIPVPHTPVLAGAEIAAALNVPCVELLEVVSLATRRESRTFILPSQVAREEAVETKFRVNPILAQQCEAKQVLLVDDSIVRGTTLKHVIRLIRNQVSPSKLYVASLAPPIVAPNVYGINIPSSKHLVAAQAEREHDIPHVVQKFFDVDAPIIYQSLTTLKAALSALSSRDLSTSNTNTSGVMSVSDFEDSVFSVKQWLEHQQQHQ
jgi:amidophosphoribosyltransferase